MKRIFSYILLLVSLGSCRVASLPDVESEGLSLSASVLPYEGETKANVAGTAFENGDWVRLKMICPFASTTQLGETVDYTNGIWLLKYDGDGKLVRLLESDGCDINGNFKPSNAADPSGLRLSQQTPYVFTAASWNEEHAFYLESEKKRYLQFSYTFQADQSSRDAYRKNDLLWAQQFMQTGTENVHLTFSHKMAALQITLNSSVSPALSTEAVLTLEGMPDIDQMQLMVGDYYADQDVYDSFFGYRRQASCSKENNGVILGAIVQDLTAKRSKIKRISGGPTQIGGTYSSVVYGEIPNVGTYTAYYDSDSDSYRLIVPPCTLENNPVFYLRDRNRRFTMELNQKTFTSGNLYKITMNLTPSTQVGE